MKIILSILLLISLAGCSDVTLSEALSTTEITFSFEAGPGTLVWWSAENTQERRSLTAAEAERGSVSIRVAKSGVTPVLLYRAGVLEPDGCIWPVDEHLDSYGGFASRILWRLLTESDAGSDPPDAVRAFCARFNWKRFSEVTAAVDNPWSLDQQAILQAIAAGTFTMKCLK